MSRHNQPARTPWETHMNTKMLNDMEGTTMLWLEIPFYSGSIDYSILQIDASGPTEKDAPRHHYKLSLRFKYQSMNLLAELNKFFQKKVIDFLNKSHEKDVKVEAELVQLPAHHDPRFPDLARGVRNWDVLIYPFKSESRAKLVLDSIKELIFKTFKGM